MKRLLFIMLLVTVQQAAMAQTWQDTVNIINKIFDRYQPEHPGCQLSISRNGKLIFSNAWGLAEMEHQIKYTSETVTEAGSISKQFTAASILILEQQGKLSLNDDIRKYLPQMPDYGSIIRIENLMHHTSGIREWSNLVAITGWPRTTKIYSNDAVFELLCKQKGLNNVPGSEFIYSNSNYVLLAMIVEKVSGMKLADFTDKYIFKPAGMTHTRWRDNYKKIVLNRGVAYSKNDNGYEINMPNENVCGPGGLLTTTKDLLKWNDFYQNEKLGGANLLDKQLAVIKLSDAGITHYAAGLFVDSAKGLKVIKHDGQTASYIGFLEYFPQLQLSIAWLSNTTEFKDNPFDGVHAVENLFIKKPETETQKAETPPASLSEEIKKRYIGWYSYEKTNEGIKIGLQHDTLLFNDVPLMPINEHEFQYKASVIKFNPDGGFILATADKRNLKFKKVSEPEINPVYLQRFTGTYYSKETNSDFKIVIQDGKLMLEKDYLKNVVLSPTYTNGFNFSLNMPSSPYPQKTNVVFVDTKQNGITGCYVSMSDARNIEFIKQ